MMEPNPERNNVRAKGGAALTRLSFSFSGWRWNPFFFCVQQNATTNRSVHARIEFVSRLSLRRSGSDRRCRCRCSHKHALALFFVCVPLLLEIGSKWSRCCRTASDSMVAPGLCRTLCECVCMCMCAYTHVEKHRRRQGGKHTHTSRCFEHNSDWDLNEAGGDFKSKSMLKVIGK